MMDKQNYIGAVRLLVAGEQQMAHITADGVAVLEDGRQIALRPEHFVAIKNALLAIQPEPELITTARKAGEAEDAEFDEEKVPLEEEAQGELPLPIKSGEASNDSEAHEEHEIKKEVQESGKSTKSRLKSLLIFAAGLVCGAIGCWLALSYMGPEALLALAIG